MNAGKFILMYQCKYLSIGKVCIQNIPLFQICCANFFVENYSEKLYAINNILFPDNMTKTAKKRKAEYLAGRLVAQQTLNLLGINNFNLTSANTGNPIWPSGIVGSISHSDSYAICVAGFKAHNFKNIGVDIERIIPQNDAEIIFDTIISNNEYSIITKTNMDFPTAITLCFSIKESVYKSINCLHPQINDFLDIQIFSISDKNIEVSVNKIEENIKLECAYEIYKNHVITYCLFYDA